MTKKEKQEKQNKLHALHVLHGELLRSCERLRIFLLSKKNRVLSWLAVFVFFPLLLDIPSTYLRAPLKIIDSNRTAIF